MSPQVCATQSPTKRWRMSLWVSTVAGSAFAASHAPADTCKPCPQGLCHNLQPQGRAFNMMFARGCLHKFSVCFSSSASQAMQAASQATCLCCKRRWRGLGGCLLGRPCECRIVCSLLFAGPDTRSITIPLLRRFAKSCKLKTVHTGLC